MNPITPEGSLSINKKLDDPVNIINVNSLDNRMQIIGKGTSANSLIVIPNADGTTVGIQLSSDFQKCFILPLASKSDETGFITAASSSSFAFVNDSVLAQTDITRGITLHSATNAGKRHFVNSNGLLAKVTDNSIRQNWIYNRASNPQQWELAGLVFEPPSRNVINPSWTGLNTGIFGVTGATTGVTTGHQSGYWDITTITGMTVYSLTEETTGSNLQNTVWIPPTGISLGSLSPNHTTAGISWSAFMLSGFFKSGGTVGGITKDIVQLWLATNPSGTVKKGIYFNLSTCSTVAASSGGTTLAFYFTEPMANGWCRCGAGVGFAGQTWPSNGQIEQFGFSTARPDGSGGYTFGGLLGTSAGSVYFSGLGVDVLAAGENLATNIYSNRLGPVQYIPPSSSTLFGGDFAVYTVKGHPNWMFPSGLTNGALNYSAFHEGLINAPVGISGEELGFGSSCWSVALSTDTSLTSNSGNNTILGHVIATRGQQTVDITPSPAISTYWQVASEGGTFSDVKNTHNRRISLYHNKPSTFGFTAGHAFRVAFSGVSGALKYFLNGQTGINSGSTGILFNQPIDNGSTGVFVTIVGGARDKKVHHKNIVFYPQTNFTDDQGKALTSFAQQARAPFIGAGGAGGYNDNTGQFINIEENQSQTNNNSAIPRPGNYEPPAIPIA